MIPVLSPTRPRPAGPDGGLPFRTAPGVRGPRAGRGAHTGPLFSATRRWWNAVKTVVVLAGLGGLLVAIGSLFGRIGALVGLILGTAVAGVAYWFSDRLALKAARAVPVDEWDMPGYHRIVRELCADAGLPMPRLYVTPDPQPNAFATGRSPRHAAVAVTQGLLDLLGPQELRAVLAHELAHVGNRDVLLTSIAAALATGISFLADLAGWLTFAAATDEDDGPSPAAALVAALVAPLAAVLLQAALSRSREFEADRTGAALLGDGRPLASALVRIERAAQRIPAGVRPAQAPHYLVNPLRGGRTRSWVHLFSTHPPVVERIARLTGW